MHIKGIVSKDEISVLATKASKPNIPLGEMNVACLSYVIMILWQLTNKGDQIMYRYLTSHLAFPFKLVILADHTLGIYIIPILITVNNAKFHMKPQITQRHSRWRNATPNLTLTQ